VWTHHPTIASAWLPFLVNDAKWRPQRVNRLERVGNRSRRGTKRESGPESVGWHREHGEFTPVGKFEQTQKFAQSVRYMRRNGIPIARPPTGMVGTVVALVLGGGALAVVVALLRWLL
jgi:hypothetical protein